MKSSENSPQMSRMFLPRIVENETKEETQIRIQLIVEKFKSENMLTRPAFGKVWNTAK